MKVAEKGLIVYTFFLLLRMPLSENFFLGLICRTDKYDVAIERMGKSQVQCFVFFHCVTSDILRTYGLDTFLRPQENMTALETKQ